VIPSSAANAVLPPALSMSCELSAGVMGPKITRPVYDSSNATCKSTIHKTFMLSGMSGKDEVTLRALGIAKEKFGWTRSDFSEKAGVSPQVITNWLARGMAPKAYQRIAKRLQITVDELLGKAPAGDPPTHRVSEPTVVAYDVKLTEPAVLFAAEWAKLPPALQAQVQSLVHTMVAELVRDGRVKKSPEKPYQTARPHA